MGYPLLWGGEAPPEMTFVVDPPGSIGAVVGAWTNQRAGGTDAIPWSLRLSSIGLWALGGFVVGLVAFFGYGGWVEHGGGHVEADHFLYALVVGALLGTFVGIARAMRPAPTLTLFVGERGCVQIQHRGADAKPDVLLWDEVESFRTAIDVMRHQGITVSTRLVYVKKRGAKKEALWYLSQVPSAATKQDPQVHYVECVMRSFAARSAPAQGAS